MADVVDDTVIAGAELAIVGARDPTVTTPRYLLLRHRGDRAAIEKAVRRAAGGTLRLRAPGETPYLRHGDAVLTLAETKARFGEFSYQATGRASIRQDPEWVAAHITAARVPILGGVRCHRALIPALRGALRELSDRNLAFLVDPASFGGCHAARLIGPGQSVSRHAWGVAVDLNVAKNPVGQVGAQDDRLVATMERWGFTWGGRWLVPDAMHFEYIQPPRTDAGSG